MCPSAEQSPIGTAPDDVPYCRSMMPHPCGPCGSEAAPFDLPSYRLASLDHDFLLSDSMRGVRFLLEYAKV